MCIYARGVCIVLTKVFLAAACFLFSRDFSLDRFHGKRMTNYRGRVFRKLLLFARSTGSRRDINIKRRERRT